MKKKIRKAPALLTTREVEEMFGIEGEYTVVDAIRAGKLAAWQPNGPRSTYFVKLEDAKAWADRHKARLERIEDERKAKLAKNAAQGKLPLPELVVVPEGSIPIKVEREEPIPNPINVEIRETTRENARRLELIERKLDSILSELGVKPPSERATETPAAASSPFRLSSLI